MQFHFKNTKSSNVCTKCVRVCIAEVAFQVNRIESEWLTKCVELIRLLVWLKWALIFYQKRTNDHRKFRNYVYLFEFFFLELWLLHHIHLTSTHWCPYEITITHNKRSFVIFFPNFFYVYLSPYAQLERSS